jgi:E-phenylitaconyl-CoA hydratase
MGVDAEIVDRVGWITLNRPERRNAFDGAMRAELAEVVEQLDGDPEVAVLAVIGAGTAFSAGADLKEPRSSQPGHFLVEPRRRMAAPVERASKPVLACINGPAMGGGLELALAADLRIASSDARFALSEIRVGSIPGSGGIQRLSRAIPQAVATRMLMTGSAIDADDALRFGLVSDVFDAAEFADRSRELAKTVAAGAPLALKAIKAATRLGAQAPLDVAVAFDDLYWGHVSSTADWQEGRQAFREGRRPEYRGA